MKGQERDYLDGNDDAMHFHSRLQQAPFMLHGFTHSAWYTYKHCNSTCTISIQSTRLIIKPDHPPTICHDVTFKQSPQISFPTITPTVPSSPKQVRRDDGRSCLIGTAVPTPCHAAHVIPCKVPPCNSPNLRPTPCVSATPAWSTTRGRP